MAEPKKRSGARSSSANRRSSTSAKSSNQNGSSKRAASSAKRATSAKSKAAGAKKTADKAEHKAKRTRREAKAAGKVAKATPGMSRPKLAVQALTRAVKSTARGAGDRIQSTARRGTEPVTHAAEAAGERLKAVPDLREHVPELADLREKLPELPDLRETLPDLPKVRGNLTQLLPGHSKGDGEAEGDGKAEGDGNDGGPLVRLAHLRPPIQNSIDIAVPIGVAWEEWEKLEFLPEGPHVVTDISREDGHLKGHSSGPLRSDWKAEVLDERPLQSFAWRSCEGSDCAGLITFHELAERLTRVELNLDVVPRGIGEAVALATHLADRHTETTLRRFKARLELISPDTYAERDSASAPSR